MNKDQTLILQYLLHKGDYYHDKAKAATEKLRRGKYLTSADFEEIYKTLMMDELFDTIQRDIYLLLRE